MPLNVMDALPQLRQGSGAGFGKETDGHPGHEVHGRQKHLESKSADGSRVPAIRFELANLGGNLLASLACPFWTRHLRLQKLSSLSKADIEGILKKTVTAAADGKYEPFKTTPIFDSTAAHPEWLGYAAQT
jgi:hypothetical protein